MILVMEMLVTAIVFVAGVTWIAFNTHNPKHVSLPSDWKHEL